MAIVNEDVIELRPGTYHWVRVYPDSDWTPARIEEEWRSRSNRLVYFICGNEVEEYVENCYELGAIIEPPVKQLNANHNEPFSNKPSNEFLRWANFCFENSSDIEEYGAIAGKLPATDY